MAATRRAAQATAAADADGGPLAIICGGGSLPFAVADAARRAAGRWCCSRSGLGRCRAGRDAIRITGSALGQFGRFCRLAREAGCRDMVFIGSAGAAALAQLWLDLATLRLLPRIYAAVRGGDDHLLSGIGGDLRGPRLSPARRARGRAGDPDAARARSAARGPRERDRADIARGLALLAPSGRSISARRWWSPTAACSRSRPPRAPTQMLARVAELRASGPHRARRPGVGVLVKAPKPGQDRRFDLPSIGPHDRRGRRRARALPASRSIAGSAIVAEPRASSPRPPTARGIFVVGLGADGRARSWSRSARAILLVAGEESGDRLGARADARRCASVARRDARSPASAATTWRRRGVHSLFPHRRSRDRRLRRDPAPAADDPAAHPRDRRCGHRGASRTCWSSSTARTSPIASRAACGPRRPRSRSSTMSRRRSGPGGRAARAPCAPMSTMCWRCCRSSRTVHRAARRAALHLCRPSAGRADRRAAAERRGGAPPAGRSAGAAGAAGQPPQRDPPHGWRSSATTVGARRGSASARSSSWCRPCRIWRDAVAAATAPLAGRPRIVVDPAEKRAAFRIARAALANPAP